VGTLYLVCTPIGNLEDLSPRALRVLSESGVVLAEDTRRTRGLMQHFGLSTPLLSLHSHNEEARLDEVLSRLSKNGNLSLVSDAGTPVVSDPGGRVIRAAIDHGHAVVPIPGPSAVLSALIGSGLPAVPFTFLGFLSRKGKEREHALDRVAQAPETVVLFESPERLTALLSDLSEACGGERSAVVAREMTKLHEEFRRGTLDSLFRHYESEGKPKGEVTVVVAPSEGDLTRAEVDEEVAVSFAGELLKRGRTPSRAAKELAARMTIPRNFAYEIVLRVRESLVPESSGSEGGVRERGSGE
jgi:16S rRNA (cytidine1402-2'-O)-methyltransferase